MLGDFILARAIHVAAVTLWIGGVGFVTMVAMPAIRRLHPPTQRLAAFHAFEGPFAFQAKISVLLSGASGLWMTWRAGLWGRFADPGYWWVHAMVLLWAGFAIMLFLVEPLFLHRRMRDNPDSAGTFERMERLHCAVLTASIATVAGAVAGSHGLF